MEGSNTPTSLASLTDSEQRPSRHGPTLARDTNSDASTDTEDDLTSSTDSSQLMTVKAKSPVRTKPGHDFDTDSDKESTCSSLIFEYSLMPLDDSTGDVDETEVTLGRSKPKDHDKDTDKNNNLPRKGSSRKSKREQSDISSSGQKGQFKSRTRSAYSSSSSDGSSVDEDVINPTLRTLEQISPQINPPLPFSDKKKILNATKDSVSSGSDKEDRAIGVDKGNKSSESGTEASVHTVNENHQNAIYQVSTLPTYLFSIVFTNLRTFIHASVAAQNALCFFYILIMVTVFGPPMRLQGSKQRIYA